MPINFLADTVFNGLPGNLSIVTVLKVAALVSAIVAVKWVCNGATNLSSRQMHSKIVMITGGTSGIGAAVALDLASRGAQIILLIRQSPSDAFVVDYIDDLRTRTGNHLIYAEQVDLTSTHSIRRFATKWIDNAPPRRLDMIILCAATLTPPGGTRKVTEEGLEETWMVNYLANFHLLSILSPAIRIQPPDRDVRIIMTTCSSYASAPTLSDGLEATDLKDWSPVSSFQSSKLALMVFGQAFQKHIDAYKRPDGFPPNARVIFVDPGYTRTPGMRRLLTRGSLWGLGVYLMLWHQAWLWLKSAEQGAQSLLFASMEADLGRGPGGKMIKECMEVKITRDDVNDGNVAKRLWEGSEKIIERVEREEAVKRALVKNDGGIESQAHESQETVTKIAPNKQSRSRKSRKAT